MSLKEKCEILLAVCKECKERHTDMREQDRDPDFFEEVKPYADKYHALLEEWREDTLTWIREKKPKYIHPGQVMNLEDMMKQFIVQSFYKRTGLKRFIQSIQSTEYTLKTIITGIDEVGDLDE